MLHLILLQIDSPATSREKSRIKVSADRLRKLPGGSEPWTSLSAGTAYALIGEHELAVQILGHAKEMIEESGETLPAVAERTLEASRIERAKR